MKELQLKKKEIANELGIPPSTLRAVLKNRPKIEQNGLVGGCKRQKVKPEKYEELEKLLLEWFQQARSLKYPVNGGIITEKAKESCWDKQSFIPPGRLLDPSPK